VAQTAAGFDRLADRMQRLVAEVAGSVEQVARSADELTELSSRLAAAENGTGP
jgi:hypothetical protein